MSFLYFWPIAMPDDLKQSPQNWFVGLRLGSWIWRLVLVGVDYLSVAAFEDPDPTHLTLLKAGVIIVEGLDLGRVPRGFYDLYCLPLKITGADGAPARVILVG